MDSLKQILDLFLHVDEHLLELVQTYGTWVYGILFGIVFMETGLVVTPFLPGDSLLFAAGALSGAGALDIRIVIPLLIAAAFTGDNVNYWIGRTVGPRVFTGTNRFFKREYLLRTEDFYARHGGKTLVLARFVPSCAPLRPSLPASDACTTRSFLPIVSRWNLLGVPVRIARLLLRRTAVVKENFSIAVLAIIFLSLTPMVIEVWKARAQARSSTKG
jgi:membrane-associated protein